MKKFKNIKQVCPECGNELIIKDFNLFLDKLRDSWALASSRFRYDDLPEDQRKHIREQNEEEYILKSLERGYIKMFCNPCSAITFWSQMEKVENE